MLTCSGTPVDNVGFATLFNTSSRVPNGSKTDPVDLKLVQYMLFWYDQTNSVPIYQIGDVDGVYGPRTQACLSRFENATPQVVADGVVDRMPPGLVTGAKSQKPYKLYMLHYVYVRGIQGGLQVEIPMETFNSTVLNMPNDGTCPPQLAVALNIAIQAATGITP